MRDDTRTEYEKVKAIPGEEFRTQEPDELDRWIDRLDLSAEWSRV